RKRVGNAAAEAEASDSELARAVGPRLQPHGRRIQVLAHLRAIDFAEQFSTLGVVAGIAADRRQPIRREGHEVLERETTSDVLDVRIEPAVFMDDEDAGQLSRSGTRRTREV